MSQLPPLPLLDVPPEAAHRVVLLRDLLAGELLIHEIYQSVQGESTFAGLPCVFVRTSVCDSRCKWCFVPETPVLMADWSWKAIGEVRPGDQLIATERADTPGQRRKVAVTTVTDCHVREAETVVVNGNVRCTPDHKFWSTGYSADNRRSAHEGWREVSRLVGFRTQFLADPRQSDTRSSPHHARVIESVVPTGWREPVITLTTTLGCYVAAGFVVKNCDTPHAFNQGERRSRADVLARARAFDCPLVEITGGEPLLQADVLPLMTELCDAGKTVLLETSGAHDVGAVDPRVHIIMDLKCPDSGESHRNRWANLAALKPTDQIKFVIASRRDWDWTANTVREHRLDERFVCLASTVFGTVPPVELVAWLLESGLFRVRVQLQMHKYIWHPTERGV